MEDKDVTHIPNCLVIAETLDTIASAAALDSGRVVGWEGGRDGIGVVSIDGDVTLRYGVVVKDEEAARFVPGVGD